MMFQLTHPLPKKFWVAVSGGVDSMAALHWLNTKSNSDRLNGVIHINHRTGNYSDRAFNLVLRYCVGKGIKFRCAVLDAPPVSGSKENWWRNQRYEVFDKFRDSVILAHHLDDCIEEYVMCSMVRGFNDTIYYNRNHCVRPFRLWRKKDIYRYADTNQIPFLEDPSNSDTKYKRNLIRNELLPIAYKLNPGLHKIVARVILNQTERP